jgi:spermidine/putrescine transport system permease protein
MIQTLRRSPRLQLFSMMFPGGFWLLLFFLIPLTIMGAISFLSRDQLGNPALPATVDNYGDIFRDVAFTPQLFNADGAFEPRLLSGLYLDLFWRSLWLALTSTLITLAIAFPTALWMARLPKKNRNLALIALMIPFWTNFLVRTYALVFMLRGNGPINTLLSGLGLGTLDLYGTPTAVMLGLVYGNLPFMILPLYTSLEKFDWTMIEAANDLGANTVRAFFRVMLPLVAPGLVAGSILTFVPSIGSYVTVDLMAAGRVNMIGYSIAQQFDKAANWPFGAAMSIVMMIIVTIAAVFYFRTTRGERAVVA